MDSAPKAPKAPKERMDSAPRAPKEICKTSNINTNARQTDLHGVFFKTIIQKQFHTKERLGKKEVRFFVPYNLQRKYA